MKVFEQLFSFLLSTQNLFYFQFNLKFNTTNFVFITIFFFKVKLRRLSFNLTMAKVTFGLSVESYDVEHLATFSIALPSQQLTTSKFAIQQLLTMEKESGIWVQRMIIKIDGEFF